MPAANESQGLKIAVAAFITLTVILAVTSYFLYAAYSSADARLTTTTDDLNKAKTAQGLAVNQYDEMRRKIGTRAEEIEPAKDEINGHFKKIDDKLNALQNTVNAAVQKAQAAGAGVQGPELQETRDNVQRVIASYRSEPNKTYSSSLDRLTELMENLSLLSTELSLNYVDLRNRLESATSVAKQQVDVQTKAASDSATDVQTEHKNHEQERGNLLTKVDQLQTDNDKKGTEIASLQQRIRQQEEDLTNKISTLLTIQRELRDRVERNENTLDRPDGYITFVDYERREVQLNISRRQGARPQMMMTVFDARSPGIPTEKPKGTVELTSVGDQFSVARIVKTMNPIEPLRIGDIVYSPAWSPNTPMRFALVGIMDVNRDGKDDRQELKRMIEEAGGVVDFDLPPLDVGKETGHLSPRIDWYVIDERPPLRDSYRRTSDASVLRESQLTKRMGEVIKDARLDGIRPMPIGRLLNFLGYDMNTPVIGRPESVNDAALKRIGNPRPPASRPAAKAATTAPGADETKTDEPKADMPKDDQPK